MNYAVRITVKKRLYHKDLIDEYTDNPADWRPCPKFKEGDEVIIDSNKPWDKPEGFCGWAWADMQKMIWGMSRGGPERFVTSCTDGYRPVIFLLERIQPVE